MRTWTLALLTTVIVTSAGTVSAASRKAPKDQFGDLFSAVNKASASKSKSSHRAAKARSARAERKKASKPSKASLVADAAPAPAPVPRDTLVLTDYAAPGQHALAGP